VLAILLAKNTYTEAFDNHPTLFSIIDNNQTQKWVIGKIFFGGPVELSVPTNNLKPVENFP